MKLKFKKIFITGHKGMVICFFKILSKNKKFKIILADRKKLDP